MFDSRTAQISLWKHSDENVSMVPHRLILEEQLSVYISIYQYLKCCSKEDAVTL